MCMGGGGGSSSPTQAITPVIQPSQAISDQAMAASNAEKRRLQASAGQQSTILTGGSGATLPTSASKSLIGS
jgi:hypothetical protein